MLGELVQAQILETPSHVDTVSVSTRPIDKAEAKPDLENVNTGTNKNTCKDGFTAGSPSNMFSKPVRCGQVYSRLTS